MLGGGGVVEGIGDKSVAKMTTAIWMLVPLLKDDGKSLHIDFVS